MKKSALSGGRAMRRPALASAAVAAMATMAALAVLSGCGGGYETAEAIVCSFQGCRESETLQVDEIAPEYRVTQENGMVNVRASFGKSANVVSTVRLSGGDYVSASSGGQSSRLHDAGDRKAYAVDLRDTSEQPTVTVNFHRGGAVHASTVTLPKPMHMLEPTGTVTLLRSQTKLNVRLDVAREAPITADANTSCARADGTRFEAQRAYIPTRLDTASAPAGVYMLDIASLHATLAELGGAADANGQRNASAISRCELTLYWRHEVRGTAAPGMNRHGYVIGERSVSLRGSYEATR